LSAPLTAACPGLLLFAGQTRQAVFGSLLASGDDVPPAKLLDPK